MALSYAIYTANGSNKNFTIPCPYLSTHHLKVYTNGNLQTGNYTVDKANNRIVFDVAPPNGVQVKVQRVTPLGERVVDFASGASLAENDLDVSAIQSLYLDQERKDETDNNAARLDNHDMQLLGHTETLGLHGSRLTNAENTLSTHGSRLNTVESTTDNHESRLDTAEADIYAAEQAIAVLGSVDEPADGEVVNVRAYGAVGDGSTDDTAAINAAVAVAKASKARLYFPRGTYLTTTGVRLPSNSYVYGDGVDATIIKAHDSATLNIDVLTNEENTGSALTNGGNTNIVVRDLTVHGNGNRSASAGSGSAGCAIQFAYVSHGRLENVKAVEGRLHCIDISAAIYEVGKPSTHWTLINCIAVDPVLDDGITTHYSGHIVIINPVSTMAVCKDDQHGLEIDDGSYDVTVLGGYATGYEVGLQIKGHYNAVAAARVKVDGFVAESNRLNYHLSHGTSPTSDTAYDVILDNCVSITAKSVGLPGGLYGAYIEEYNNVRIRDFTMVGDPTKSGDSTQVGRFQLTDNIKNIHIDGFRAKDINSSDGVIRILSTAGTNISIRHAIFRDCYCPAIHSTNNLGLVVEDVTATLTDTSSPVRGVILLSPGTMSATSTSIRNIVANAGYSSAVTDNDGSGQAQVPLGVTTELGARNAWVRANSDGNVAGAYRYVHSVGWAAGSQNLGEGEGVGYGFKFKVQDGSEYTGAHIVSYKDVSTDANTGTRLRFATRSDGDAGTGCTDRWEMAAAGHLRPVTDGAMDIGAASQRVRTIHANALSLKLGSSVTPSINGEMQFELTSDTSLKIKVKGSDGTVRSATIALS